MPDHREPTQHPLVGISTNTSQNAILRGFMNTGRINTIRTALIVLIVFCGGARYNMPVEARSPRPITIAVARIEIDEEHFFTVHSFVEVLPTG